MRSALSVARAFALATIAMVAPSTSVAEPVITDIAAATGSATITFDGVSGNTTVTASCFPVTGGAANTSTGSSSPITISGLADGTTHLCKVSAEGSDSAFGTVTPPVRRGSYYSGLYVFGDSNSDNGRRLVIQGRPTSPYWNGRHSNGPSPTDVLAAHLGLASGVENPTADGVVTGKYVNYAVGGALSGRGNLGTSQVLEKTGLLDQFDTFVASHPTADPNALYFLWGGENDLTSCRGTSRDQCTQAQLEAVIENNLTLIRGLAAMGARHFLVAEPIGGGQSKSDFRTLFRTRMASVPGELGVNVVFFRARSLWLAMYYNGTSTAPGTYGYGITQGDSSCYSGTTSSAGTTQCANPSEYLSWDATGHMTSKANYVTGTAMLGALLQAAYTTTTSADCLFNWAERQYTQWFSPSGGSTTLSNYYYRHYSESGNYLATSSENDRLWLLGPLSENTLLDIGSVSDFLAAANCR